MNHRDVWVFLKEELVFDNVPVTDWSFQRFFENQLPATLPDLQ